MPTGDLDAGSSPRMRGTPRINRIRRPNTGIIPADAGNTILTDPMAGITQDHPRGCGEHKGMSRFISSVEGSSPRMRGTPVNWKAWEDCTRIIPADAGNTSLSTNT